MRANTIKEIPARAKVFFPNLGRVGAFWAIVFFSCACVEGRLCLVGGRVFTELISGVGAMPGTSDNLIQFFPSIHAKSSSLKFLAVKYSLIWATA